MSVSGIRHIEAPGGRPAAGVSAAPPPVPGLPGDRLSLSRPPGRSPGIGVDRSIAEKLGVAAFSIGMVGGTVAVIGAAVFGAPVWVPVACFALAGAGALAIAFSGTSRPAGSPGIESETQK